MERRTQQPEQHKGTIATLSASIVLLTVAKEAVGITPAKAALGPACILLTNIKDSMANQNDYVDLGQTCADACLALSRGLEGKSMNELSNSVCEAIKQLTADVAETQKMIIKQGKRSAVSRVVHAGGDKAKIAAWRLKFLRILQIFNTELSINTSVVVSEIYAMVSEMHRSAVSKGQEGNDGKNFLTQSKPASPIISGTDASSTLGESPPPAPRACFGRDGMIDKIVGLAENLTPIALTGAGGIGKTSVVLAVLHHDRIKKRFGKNRRFIRCDQFTTSYANFLSRLSKVIGAGVDNPENLASLRPFLSSKAVLIILDNAESILDPQAKDAQEIYATVEELSRLENVCLCITSRISTIPPDCEPIEVPTLSIEAAREAFYRVYKNREQSGLVDNILDQLAYHPLSITLLATVGHQNKWSMDILVREWETRRTSMLQTEHSRSLATAIELSLASPMFQKLGRRARAFLGVIAFFPQGVDEKNLSWLFPTVSNRMDIVNKFCILSLTYRSDGFITMLAPLRDYLSPKDPKSSSLLRATKKRYFARLSVDVHPDKPNFREARWIRSEDVNVEHLLDVFITIDKNSSDVWKACIGFLRHLFWHKRRLTILKPKIEKLPDDHRYKPECFELLSRLFDSVGNPAESKRLLSQALKIAREWRRDAQVAELLCCLSNANRWLGLRQEGIQQVKESLEIYKRLRQKAGQATCLVRLAFLLVADNQFDAAEEAALSAIDLIPGEGNQLAVCQSHRILGLVYRHKSEVKMAIHHYNVVLRVASSFGWDGQLFWAHYALAELFRGQGQFDDALSHLEHAKSLAINDAYLIGRAVELQAWIRFGQRRLEEARLEAQRAVDSYEKSGAVQDLKRCRGLLRDIQKELDNSHTSGQSGNDSQ